MRKLRYKLAKGLVHLANQVAGNYTPLDIRIAWIDNHDFIDRGHLQSLVDQGDDMLLSAFLDDSGWVKLSDLKHEDGTPYTAQESADMISKSLTLEATRQEQEELNK